MKADESFIATRKLFGRGNSSGHFTDKGESFSKNGYKNKHVSTTDESTPLRRLASEVIFKAVKDYKEGLLKPDNRKAVGIAMEALSFLRDTESPWHRALNISSGVFYDMIEKVERDTKKIKKEQEDLPSWWKDTMPKRGGNNENN